MKIKEARRRAGLSQSQAAKAWGINLVTLKSWEGGKRHPRGLALTKLQEILSQALSEQPPGSSPTSTVA